jgi:hypothetical protein
MWKVTSTPHKRLNGGCTFLLPAFEEGADSQIKVIIFNDSRKRILHKPSCTHLPIHTEKWRFCADPTAFYFAIHVRRAIRRYLQLQCTNKQLIYVYDSSFTAGLAYKAQYIARVNDLQQLYVNQTPSWEELFEQLLNKLAASLPYSLQATTGLAKGTKMWIKIQYLRLLTSFNYWQRCNGVKQLKLRYIKWWWKQL